MSELGPDQRPEGWDKVTSGYERVFEPLSRLFAEELVHRAGVSPGDRVLDVGTGPGVAALLAARRGADVLAVDYSPAMIERLQRRIHEDGLKKARAEVMDGQALDLPDASFDVVLSNFAVIFFPDIGRGLAEMRRVLRPGGRAAITAWSVSERMQVVLVLMRALRTAFPEMPPPPRSPVQRLSEADAFEQHMREAGFRNVRIETFAREWEVPSAAWLAENLAAGFSPGLAFLFDRLGPDEKKRLLEVLAGQLHEEFGDRGVRLSCEAHLGLGEA